MAHEWGGDGSEEYVGKHRKEPGCWLTLVAAATLIMMVVCL